MANNKWLTKLQKHPGVVIGDDAYNPLAYENCIHTPSPSLDWAFGHEGHGIPFGDGALMGGPAKSGKSFVLLNMVKSLHAADPEAIAIIYNTEFRADKQARPEVLRKFGVDPDRLVMYNTNRPDEIFDHIVKEVDAMCQDGAPIKLIGIDSLSMIGGRRFLNQDTVNTMQIGDHAQTLSVGLKMILPVYKRNKIAFVGLTHVRAELDPIMQMRGNKFKLQSATATDHQLEFFIFIDRNETKEGRKDAYDNALVDESIKGFDGKAESRGHKVKFKIMDSSYGRRGRVGQFTLDFERGIINQFEEIANLAVNTNVVERPNQVTYAFEGETFKGWDNYIKAVETSPELQKRLMDAVYAKDSE